MLCYEPPNGIDAFDNASYSDSGHVFFVGRRLLINLSQSSLRVPDPPSKLRSMLR